MADGNVQHISELGFDYSQILKDFEEIERLVREEGVKLWELSQANWKVGVTFENRAAGGDAMAANILKNSDALKKYAAAFEESGVSAETFKRRQDALNEGLVKSQVKMSETSNALTAAKKAYKELNDETSRMNLEKAFSEHNKAKQEVGEFGAALKNTAKEAKAYDELMRRAGSGDAMAAGASKANQALKEQSGLISEVDKKQQGLIANSWKWFGAHEVWNLLKKGMVNTVETMRDVETSMMEIARVMEYTAEQSDNMRDSLFGVSSAMAQTFDDTSDISLKFAQAGYHDVTENIEMTRVALLAMNTAELDAVNSTNSMVGILQQWKLEASDLSTVIDKLNYTADENAITTQDLVDGLLRTSSAAKNAKLSFNETVGTLVALKEATGRAGKELGTATNSIIAFTTKNKSLDVFESLGATVWADEQKTTLVSVMDIWRQLSAMYKTEGDKVINVLSAQTDMTELFSEEVAAASSATDEYNQMLETQTKLQGELNDAERKSLTEQFGVYRRNYVIALLENFEKIGQVAGEMDNSIGHSARENARYMETMEAKTKQLITSLQELAVQAGEAGLMDLAKDALTVATALTNASKATGGLVPMLISIASVVAIIKRAAIAKGLTDILGTIKNLPSKIKDVANSIYGVDDAGKAAQGSLTGMIGVAMMTAVVVTSITNAIKHMQEESRKADIEAGNSAQERVNALEKLASKHEQLMELGVSSDDEQYLSLQGQIVEALGGRSDTLEGLTAGTKDYASALQGAIDKEYEYIKTALEAKRVAQGEQLQNKAKEMGVEASGVYLFGKNITGDEYSDEELVAKYYELIELQKTIASGEEYKKGEAAATRYFKAVSNDIGSLKAEAEAYHKTIVDEIALEYQRANGYVTTTAELEDLRQHIYDATGATEAQQIATDKLLAAMFPMAQLTSNTADATDTMAERIADSAKKMETLNTAIDNIQSSYSTLAGATEEYNKTGLMEIDTLQALLNLSPEYLAALDLENGKLIINEQSIRNLTEQLKAETITKLESARSSDILAIANGNVGAVSDAAKGAVNELSQYLANSGANAQGAVAGLANYTEEVRKLLSTMHGKELELTTKAIDETNALYDKAIKNAEVAFTKVDFSSSSVIGSGGTAGASKAAAAALKKETDAINEKIKAQEKAKKISDEYYDNEIDLIQRAQKAADRANKDILDALKERQKARQDYWKDQEDSVKKAYDAEIDALKRLKEAESRGDERADYEKSRAELEVEKADQQKRTGREAVERIKEIDKALADLDEKEARRLRDNDLDDRISAIEDERDSELEAIKEKAEAENKRYEDKIKATEKAAEIAKRASEDEIQRLKDEAEEKKKGFEKTIEDLRTQLETAKKTAEGVGSAFQGAAKQGGDSFDAMYKFIMASGQAWAIQAVKDGENVLSVYNRLVAKMKEAQSGQVYGPVQGGSLPNFNTYGPEQYGALAFDWSKIKTSHTGSLVTGDGLVNVQAGEIIVRKDISENLQRAAQMMNQYSTTNNVTNNRSAPVMVDLRGAHIGSGVSGQRAGQDIGAEILKNMGNLS